LLRAISPPDQDFAARLGATQFRAATALWQRLSQREWPGFEGATVPKEQAPATIPADRPIRRIYLLASIDATKHPQMHGHWES
jgi:hypothetical protein